jgi:hypothetical protein
MPDDSSNYAQHLSSAKYYYDAQQADDGAAEPQSYSEPPQPSLDNTLRCVSQFVGLMLLVAIGAVTWKHRQSLVDAAGAARDDGFNPIRMVFRASGVDKKFADALAESQRQTAAEFDKMNTSYFGEDFKPLDTTQLWAPSAQDVGKWGGS